MGAARGSRLLRQLVLPVWLALVPAATVGAETTILTLQETRQAAVTAYQIGAFAQAEALARALLRRDPRDLAAQIVLIEVAAARGDHEAALDMATYGYRIAETDGARYTLARLAAREHAILDHGTRAQLWLRRAHEASPNETEARAVAEDFAFIRSRNPLSISVNGGIAPRSNINNGSSQSTQEIVIFGIPVTLPLSGSEQALSGTAFNLGGDLALRLDDRPDLRTTLGLSLFGETYTMSTEAIAQAPGAKGEDFAYANAELSLRQERRVGEKGAILAYGASAGTMWTGGAPYYDFTRLNVALAWQRTSGLRERLDLQNEQQSARAGGDPRRITELSWRGDWTTAAGNQVSAAVRFTQSAAVNPNYAYEGVAATLSWAPREAFVRGHWSFSGEIAGRDYAPSILSPEPRADRSASARVTYRPDSLEYFGFRPEFSMTGRINRSNMARFDTRDISLGLRFLSAF